MTAERDIRIGDADRNVVIERLQVAYAEGRIDTAELEERLELAHRARSRSDLVTIVADLPGELPTLPVNASPPVNIFGRIQPELARAAPLLFAPIICTLIYLMTIPGGYFWPMWVWFGCSIPLVKVALQKLGGTSSGGV